MNKKLIAVAVAAAFAAPMAASADATIYGSLHSSLENRDTDDSTGTQIRDDWDVLGNDGQIGIKGSEDLGGGLKALYKIEMNYDTSGGSLATQAAASPAMTWDEVWVGLTGSWGTALIGREDTPYKTFMDTAKVDILGDSIVDVDTMLTAVGGDGFERFTANGAIAYVSPNFSGFTFGAAIVPGGQSIANGVGPSDTEDGIADHYSLGANYIAGGLRVAVGYEKKVPVSGAAIPAGGTDDDQTNWAVGASYTFGAFQIGAKYEDEENVDFHDGADAERFAATGKYSFGNNAVGVVYTYDEEDGVSGTAASSDIDADGYGIFAEHKLSNRTKVYAAYSTVEDDESDAESDAFAAGVIHSF